MPVAVQWAGVAVLEGQIYAVGGANAAGSFVANTQIYSPITNTWSTGGPLPTATGSGCAAAAGNALYYIGGFVGPADTDVTNAVWAYDPSTQTWFSRAPKPTAEEGATCVVENDIIYVSGGYNGSFLATVESYNPATNSWTSEAPLLLQEDQATAGLVGTTIIVTDGSDNIYTGYTQGYDAETNTWTPFNADPTARQDTCGGVIGSQFYSAGGWDGGTESLTLTESFTPSTNAWTTLASMPFGTNTGGAAVYDGQLYCFGGVSGNDSSSVVGNVQIYQPYAPPVVGVANEVFLDTLSVSSSGYPLPCINGADSLGKCFSIQQNFWISVPHDSSAAYWAQNIVLVREVADLWFVASAYNLFDSTGKKLLSCGPGFVVPNFNTCFYYPLDWTLIGLDSYPIKLQSEIVLPGGAGADDLELNTYLGVAPLNSFRVSGVLPSQSSVNAALDASQIQSIQPLYEPELVTVGDWQSEVATFSSPTLGGVGSLIRFYGQPWEAPGTIAPAGPGSSTNPCISTGETALNLVWTAPPGTPEEATFQWSADATQEGLIFFPARGGEDYITSQCD
jgi:N-acetylneuraminic acid mutarotase